MPPGPLFGVVIDRQLALAVRAPEPGPLGMLHPYVHAAVLGRQVDPFHLPGRDQSQQVSVQLCVSHETDPAADQRTRA